MPTCILQCVIDTNVNIYTNPVLHPKYIEWYIELLVLIQYGNTLFISWTTMFMLVIFGRTLNTVIFDADLLMPKHVQ